MTKLYWIVCEDNDSTLFEGRYMGRTRGSAIRFLKSALDRSSLKGLVYTVTEIPVPLIREIVTEMLASMIGIANNGDRPNGDNSGAHDCSSRSVTISGDLSISGNQQPVNLGGPSISQSPSATRKPSGRKVGNPGLGDDFWQEVRAHWESCRSIKQTAIKFKLSQNSVKTRARREGWRTKPI
jgi:hypothetical protein